MAIYNQNYEAKLLTMGGSPYNIGILGDGYSASTVHQLFCLSTGVISVTAFGGGSFNWSATTSQYLDVVVGNCSVISGQFVGFKSHFTPIQQSNAR